MSDRKVLVQIDHVKKYFYLGMGKTLKAVDDISLEIMLGETLALVGESGCGKSTLGRTVIGAYRPTGGTILYDGINLATAGKKQRLEMTRRAQMIFQDPYSSLDQRMTVSDIIAEGIDIHKLYQGSERRKKIDSLLTLVGLSPKAGSRFPHEFSGGQRQRIGIARALAVNPEFLVCDEPISALDVSIQAQIVNLMRDLQQELGLTNLFIAHDMNMVRYISDRTAVMYLGHIMELGNSCAICDEPLHPYSQALMSSVPVADPEVQQQKKPAFLDDDIASPIHPPKGCVFCTRCPHATEKCRQKRPEFRSLKSGRQVACFLFEEDNQSS